MSDDYFTNSNGSGGYTADTGERAMTGLSTLNPQTGLNTPTMDFAKGFQTMQRNEALGETPGAGDARPDLLPPNMLVLAPSLAPKYPDIYSPERFSASMEQYGNTAWTGSPCSRTPCIWRLRGRPGW